MSKLIDPVILENAFVRLIPFAEPHREPLRKAANDPALWRFHGLNQYNATFDAYFDEYLGQTARSQMCAYVILDVASGEVAGSSAFLVPSPANKRVEIGSTWYAAAFQGTYVNPAAKLSLIGHIIDTLGWNRVEFKLDARNTRSRAAMRKLGAVEEGVHRSHMILPDGHIRDSVWFSVTQADWPQVKAGLDARLA